MVCTMLPSSCVAMVPPIAVRGPNLSSAQAMPRAEPSEAEAAAFTREKKTA